MIIADAHCDVISKAFDNGEDIWSASDCAASGYKLSAGGVAMQYMAIWMDPKDYGCNSLATALRMLEFFLDNIHRHEDKMALVYKAEDIDDIIGSNRIAVVLTLEGGEILSGSLEILRLLYRLGLRGMALTWNYSNELADGAGELRAAGLTELGVRVVQTMSELHMLIDVSHLSYKGFWDVIEHTSGPIMATHSNVYALCPHVRNLKDDQIKAIIDRRGFIGINFFTDFLTTARSAALDDILRHIEYIAAMGGIKCIGLGADFDGMNAPPVGLTDASKYGYLVDRLIQLNYKQSDIECIMGKNLLNITKSILQGR